jgi:hypothetical protein
MFQAVFSDAAVNTDIQLNMKLTDLGFNSWFQERRNELQKPELSIARITRVDRDRYLVRNEHDEVQAEATGQTSFLPRLESGPSLRGRLGFSAVLR